MLGPGRHQTQLSTPRYQFQSVPHPEAVSYPTDAKEREKTRRKEEKAQGIEKKVVKRKKVMEEHYDDCGDDLSSLHLPEQPPDVALPCAYDTDDALSDEDHNERLLRQLGTNAQVFPVDITKVAQAQPGEPQAGPDPRDPTPSESPCPGCRNSMGKVGL